MLVVFATPYGLGYPTSESMEPTLSQDDVYILGPAIDVSTGDIVVFDQSGTERGFEEATVHRIVGQTNKGYITQGDANEETDQQLGAPPVTESQITGKVVTFGGEPISIPNSYRIAQTLIENSRLIGVVGVLLVTIPIVRGALSSAKSATRSPTRPLQTRELLTIVTVIVFIGMTLFFFLTPSVHVWTTVATTGETAEQSQVNIPVDESVEKEISFNHSTETDLGVTVPTVQGGDIQSTTYGDDAIAIKMEVGPYNTKGEKEVNIVFYRYPAILPGDWIRTLHSIHPFVASLASSATIIFPIGFVVALLVPNAPMRIVNRLSRMPFKFQ